MNGIFFLHGLDSSGNGTKGRFFAEHFPEVERPDFEGTLLERIEQLEKLCAGYDKLIFVGSSFGGLMGTCFAIEQPERVHRLVLLAPALNFAGYEPPNNHINVENFIVIGSKDVVTPPTLVIPKVEETFANPQIREVDDDHFLHQTFAGLDWPSLLGF